MTVRERSRVALYAKSTAVAATPVRPGKTYPLSVLDHAMARHTLRLVFYYLPSPTMERDKLKESLSEVLSHYPAMTGRLMLAEEEKDGRAGKWVVKCNDAGVRLIDAKASVTLDEWLASATATEETELAYWEPVGTDHFIWSPFYVQITEFEDKGFAIGLTCTHMHADPTCAMLFIKAWSDTHRRAHISNPPFFHPPALRGRAAPNTATPSAAFLSAKSSSPSPPVAKMSSATFRFSDNAVLSLLADLSYPDTTPSVALASLFWSRVGDSNLTLAVDFRKLMHAPLPHGFYGNALHFSRLRADPAAGLSAVTAALKEHIAGTKEEEYWSAVDWFEERRGMKAEVEEAAFQMYGPELTCVMLDHVPAYGAAFDGGRAPAHVTCRVEGIEGEGVVVVMTAPEEGAGRTVAVTLPEEVMTRVLKDDAIAKYGPTVLLSGRV